MARHEVFHCPRCQLTFRDIFAALSRKDNRTEICPACGIEESMEDAHLVPPYTGHTYWEKEHALNLDR